MKSKQYGITLFGFLAAIVIVGFFGFMAMKLVPAYVEFAGIDKALTQEATGSVNGKTLDDIRRDVMFKLGMQYVDDATIKPKDIMLTRDNGASTLSVAYDKKIPFIYNISFLVHFEKDVTLQGNVE